MKNISDSGSQSVIVDKNACKRSIADTMIAN